jgi:hypothetical protein
LILIATREFLNREPLFERFFANAQVTVVAIAIDEFGVLMNFVRLVSELPRWRGKVDGVINLRTRVAVFLSARRSLKRDDAECQKTKNPEKTNYRSQ